MNLKILPAALLLASAAMQAAAHPIVIRHDRNEADYRVLGERYAASLCLVKVPDGSGYVVAEGTLIDPRWVLTAAHVARYVRPGHTLQVAGQTPVVKQVILHPSWHGPEHDLALIAFEQPVTGAAPLPLYRAGDEVGREIIVVGRGGFGTGETGPTHDDGVLRGALNRIDEAGPGWLSFVFDAPDAPNTTDLEGISGPGDSGGPGILLIDGTPYLAGISSGQDDAATGRPGVYGVTEYYTRVSHYAAWIDAVMAGTEAAASVRTMADCDGGWEFPDTPVGERSLAFFKVVCQGDEAAGRRFVEEHVAPSVLERNPMDRQLQMLEMLHADLGRATMQSLRITSPTVVGYTVRSEHGGTFQVSIEVEPAAPHRIVGLNIEQGGAGPQPEAPDLGSLDDVDAYLQGQAAAETFSGVVLVARNGDVLFENAYGWADHAQGVRNTLDTRFNLGSINKLFTSVAVLQLAERGKLDLDAPIGTYLDGFPPEVAGRVTVRHLLQHRSGWRHYWENPQYLANKDHLQSLDDYLAFIRTIPLDFEPGTQEQYSNVGFEVLGGIIERVSGQTYYDYIRDHVYATAGMTDSDSFHRDAPGLAMGYVQENARGYEKTNAGWLGPRGSAAGGGYATARDLLRFEQALLAHRLLAPASTALLFNRFETPTDTTLRGGVGFGGGAPGVSAVWEKDFGTGYTIIVLSNFDPPIAGQTGQAILKAMQRMQQP